MSLIDFRGYVHESVKQGRLTLPFISFLQSGV